MSAMKVTMWCDLCPTLLELEGFEIEIRTRQVLPRQDRTADSIHLHVCGECEDRLRRSIRPLLTKVNVTASIEKGKGGKS